MDIRSYYQKKAVIEQQIAQPFTVVVSEDTPDGGRAGLVMEVSRAVAAQMIVEGRARFASEEETKDYFEKAEADRMAAEQQRTASRLQVAVLSDNDVRQLKSNLRLQKG